MKTLAHSLLTALLLSTATLASAETITSATLTNPTVTTDSYKVVVFPSSIPSKLNVFVERTPGQSMSVLLKGADGKILARQIISKKQGNFRFVFDMSEAEDGAYSVEVSSGNDVTIYPVTLATQPVQVATRTITLN